MGQVFDIFFLPKTGQWRKWGLFLGYAVLMGGQGTKIEKTVKNCCKNRYFVISILFWSAQYHNL